MVLFLLTKPFYPFLNNNTYCEQVSRALDTSLITCETEIPLPQNVMKIRLCESPLSFFEASHGILVKIRVVFSSRKN